MIKSYLLNGEFSEQNFEDFKKISATIEENRKKIACMRLDLIIELLDRLGKKLIEDRSINALPGISFIAMWLRKENLKNICRLNYLEENYFEEFKSIGNKFSMRAQPRGIVCHWIAGNMPTLAFFSLVQSILSKNGSIVKVPEHNKEIILAILRNLNNIEGGLDILRSLSIVSFDHNDYENSKNFSMVADCKVVWGGAKAIEAITALPQKEHCEIISFGPKYSFGVFDSEFIESEDLEKALGNCVTDIVLFNQMACSSPHVLFFEKSKYAIEEIGQKMKSFFEKLPDKFLNQNLPESTAANIINVRGMYLLDKNKQIIKSKNLGWTILINNEPGLEEPVQGKVIFIKEIDNVNLALDFITRKIQAITVCILNPEKRKIFAEQATYRGVDRIMVPGKIHDFSLPWDGMLTLNRLVRWVILKDN